MPYQIRSAPFILGTLLLAAVTALSACGQAAQPVSQALETASAPGQVSVARVEQVQHLALDPSNKSLLITAPDGVYRSSDGGQSWRRLPMPSSLAASGFKQVVVNPDNPAVLYVAGSGFGVIRSDDSGQTWKQVTNSLPSREVAALAIHSFRRDTLYAWIKGQGVFQTEDGGKGWRRVDPGPPNVAQGFGLTHSTLPGSMNTGWLYAATPTGAYLSMDCF